MRVRYEVDPYNKLIRVKKFRQVVHGRFKIDKKNRLYYEIVKSSKTDVPQKIKFFGKYSLDKNHNLIYSLSKWNNQVQGNRLRIRTRLIDASSNEMVFLLSMVPRTSFGATHQLKQRRSTGAWHRLIYTMKLHGAWQADRANRLTFGVKREHDRRDILTFFNAWEINKNSEIVYTYGHGRDRETITLKGRWNIKDRYRLRYILDKRINSGFNFETSLGQLAPKGKKIYLKFDVTLVLSKRKRIRRKIIFSGKLKMGKGKELLLERSFGRRKRTSLKFTRDILDQKGTSYIEAFLKDKEKYIGGGVGFRW